MVKGQGHQARLTSWPKISHIFETGSSTNFKLGIQMEYDDPYHRHAQRPPTSKLWVAVQVTIYRGRGHIVSAPLQAAQLVGRAFYVIYLFSSMRSTTTLLASYTILSVSVSWRSSVFTKLRNNGDSINSCSKRSRKFRQTSVVAKCSSITKKNVRTPMPWR